MAHGRKPFLTAERIPLRLAEMMRRLGSLKPKRDGYLLISLTQVDLMMERASVA